MQFHYDLSNAEPIIRDLPVGGSSDILEGAGISRSGAIATALNHFAYQNVIATTLIDFIGVAAEFYDYNVHISNSGANAATAAATGVTNYIKVIINPLAVWLTEYSQHADDDQVNTLADTDGNVVTATFTSPGDDRAGDWVYITDEGSTTGGAGNLFQIGAGSETAMTACTSYDNDMKANNTSDTFILIQNPYTALVIGGSIALSASGNYAGKAIKGADLTGLYTGAAITLQNYITDKGNSLQPLRVEQHSGKNFDAATCHLYADLFFTEHLCLGSNTAAQPTIS